MIYFRSTASALGSTDVAIDVSGRIVPAHTISFLGDGIWQANRLLDQALADNVEVRIRLGGGGWSKLQQIRRA